jgi:hypothetical protein
MIARVLILLIRIYQWTLSPLLGPVCRFEPSCSRYAVACLSLHGALKGSWLTIRRLSRCHPFHPGGYDPPPPCEGTPLALPAAEPSSDEVGSAARPS